MTDQYERIAKACLEGAEDGRMTFPQIVATLMQAGFEGYMIDFRRADATYYAPNDRSVVIQTPKTEVAVAPTFHVAPIRTAIKEAQQLVPGYTYKGFCEKVAAAGCAGYIVSFAGRRALYFGRTAETHVEHFPD